MNLFKDKKILLGICGSIAAYKAAPLVRELTQRGAKVRVVMTQSAEAFITPLTFQALTGESVRTQLFDDTAEHAMGHIELARWAHHMIIAPASANTIAQLANGFASDLLSTLYLVMKQPVIICPAMNPSMWSHPATMNNVAQLKRHGVLFVEPEQGMHACGEEGDGRLAATESIIHTLQLLDVREQLRHQKVLITAGPTQERLDPVRFLSNDSSGKMGYALAIAAKMAGAEVTLISGPTALKPPHGIDFYRVTSAQEMLDSVLLHLKPQSIFIGAAAVADQKPQNLATQKIKKQTAVSSLNLIPTPDIIKQVTQSKKAQLVVGFAAETESLIPNALEKLHSKHLDLIIANQVGPHQGFHVDTNEVTLISKNTTTALPMMDKIQLAGRIMTHIASLIQPLRDPHETNHTN